jgi:hypothetical protein
MRTPELFRFSSLFALAIAASLSLSQYAALAAPYASGLDNTAGTVSFRLNEAADDVRIISNGGATTNALGPLSAGPHSFALGITGTFQVRVANNASPGYFHGAVNQISQDANTLLRFVHPAGVAVNRNPASPAFGRVYVANSTNATTTTGRSTQDGIYLLNPDLTDALGQGDSARTGGLNFTTGDAKDDLTPFRLTVGPDDQLYIADFSDSLGTLYVADRDVSPGSGAIVLDGQGGPFPVTSSRIHGSISSSYVDSSFGRRVKICLQAG